MKDEALKLALEDLEHFEKAGLATLRTIDAIIAIKKVLAQPEPEPVAWMHNFISENVIAHRPADLDRHPDRWTALYAEPKPCPTCEALARTVMLDQTSHDTSPPKRKPLTDEEISAEVEKELTHYWNGEYIDTTGARDHLTAFARAIEAAHGIKGEA